jgi:chromosome partitioning protein
MQLSRAYPQIPQNNSKDYQCIRSFWLPKKAAAAKARSPSALLWRLSKPGTPVRLIETDSQGTLSNWQARRSYAEPLVEPVYSAGDIEGKLLSLNGSGVTLTIIDTAGGVSAVTTAAIRYADLCLIPSRPSVADV